MKLTPLDIRHKEFKRGMRGYVDGEVDEFLDEVADEFERLFKENIELTERGEALQEKLDQYRNLEETLQNNGMPPNPSQFNPGFLTWPTDGKKVQPVIGGDSHPIAACMVPPPQVVAVQAAGKK